MPATITKKCQNVVDFIEKYRDGWVYKERDFSHNTQVSINSDGSFSIRLFSTKIVEFIKSRNEYVIKNWGRWTRTTAHDIRAYLGLLLGYRLDNWDIFTDHWLKIEPEVYTVAYGTARRWTFNPTNLIFKWDEDGE